MDENYTLDVASGIAVSADLGDGMDFVYVTGASSLPQVRLTFTSSEVGNGNSSDAGTGANQDGGLAVRVQPETVDGSLTGAVSRFDDEGITFLASGAFTFDVRDLVSGIARGSSFSVVTLGTMAADTFQAAQATNYYINGGMGADRIVGNNGDDFLVGGAGNDVLRGGRGNDSFIGGGGDDRIVGGTGDDSVFHNISTDGADVVDLGDGADGVNFTVASGVSQVRLTFTSAEVGNGNSADANGTAQQDGGLAVRVQLEGANGDLTGGVARFDDEGITFATNGLFTFDVRDLVSGVGRGDQFDIVTLGTSQADVYNGGNSLLDYYVNGGAGNDDITGGDGNDFLVGGAGEDTLNGGGGNDRFITGGGADRVIGGEGDDMVIYNVATDGEDRVNLGGGADMVMVTAAAGATQVRLSFTSSEVGNGDPRDAGTQANQDGNFAVRLQAETAGQPNGTTGRFDDEGITFMSSTVTFDVRDLVAGTQRGELFNAVNLGSSGADIVDGTGNDNIAYYVNGGAGDDVITSAGAADFLVGGAGNDRLNGAGGNDQLLGGGGSDTFVFSGTVGADSIVDFVSGTDKIDFSAFGITADNVRTGVGGTDTFVDVDSNRDGTFDFQLRLVGVTTVPASGDYVF